MESWYFHDRILLPASVSIKDIENIMSSPVNKTTMAFDMTHLLHLHSQWLSPYVRAIWRVTRLQGGEWHLQMLSLRDWTNVKEQMKQTNSPPQTNTTYLTKYFEKRR